MDDLKEEREGFRGRSITLSILNVTITVSSSYAEDDITKLKSVIYEMLRKVKDNDKEYQDIRKTIH